MKKHRILQYAFIIFILSAIAGGYFYFRGQAAQKINSSQTPKLTDGLVGYWTFDGADMTATTATDMSVNDNTETIGGTVTKVPGKIGQALNFNGSTGYLNNTSNPNLGITDITECAWIYSKVISSNQVFMHYANTADGDNLGLRINASGGIEMIDGNGGGIGSNATLSINNWYHVCVTVIPTAGDGNDQSKIYINGNLDNSDPASNYNPASENGLRIGSRIDGGQYFNGYIDEPRIYSRALSASEITELYQQGQTKINARQTNKLTDGLVGYWTMDGNNISGNTLIDSSGQGNNGTIYNATATIGKIGQGLSFDGTGDYIEVSDATNDFDFGTGNFTMSMWVISNQGGRVIIGKDDYNTASDNGVVTYQTGGKVFSYWNGVEDITPNINLNTSWNQVSIVREGTGANQLKFYLNGSLIHTGSDSRNLNNSRNLFVGSDSGFNSFFNGKLDEVRIYSRALSASEITELYQQGQTKINASQAGKLTDGLVGYWTMDGADINWGANTITNRGTLGGTGTLTNMSQTTDPKIGKIGQALNFDGTNNYINNGDILGFDVDDAFSASFWVKPIVISSGYPIAKWSGGGMNGWYLQFNSNKLYFIARDEGDQQINVYHSDTPELNIWQHYTMTYNGSGDAAGVRIYRNGIANQTVVLNTAPVSLLNSNPFTIGTRSSFTGPLNGSMDEVRIYSRELSQSEVTELYNMGR